MTGNRTSINQTIYGELFPSALSKADKKRLVILEAAIQTYAELGVEYVSYEDIARKAKVTRPLVNHYFPDKKVLFEGAIKFIRAHFQELAVTEIRKFASPTDQLKAYVVSTVNWLRVSPAHAKAWVFFFYVCVSDAKLRSLHKVLTSMGEERLIELLRNVAIERGYKETSLREKAKTIQRLITGALLELGTEYDPKDSVAYEELIQQTVTQSLRICDQQ